MDEEPRPSRSVMLALALLILAGGVGGFVFSTHRNPAAALPPTRAGTSTPVVTLRPPLPWPRVSGAMAYDPFHDDVVLFGGVLFDGLSDPRQSDDTWTFDSQGWRQRHPLRSPPALTNVHMTEDPATRTLLLVGDLPDQAPNPQSGPTLETWSWDGEQRHQFADVPAEEWASALATMAWSTAGAGGGVLLVADLPAPLGSLPPATSTWTWHGRTWSRQQSGTRLPVGVPAMIGDPLQHRVVAVVSLPAGQPGEQTWEWHGQTWSQLTTSPTVNDIPTQAPGMALDPHTGYPLLYVPIGDRDAARTWMLSGNGWFAADTAAPPIQTLGPGSGWMLADARLGTVIAIGTEGSINRLDSLWLWERDHWRAVPAATLQSRPGPPWP